MRHKQPRLLVIWGRDDLSFDLGEPERYRRDVPNAEVYILDAGHFAVHTKGNGGAHRSVYEEAEMNATSCDAYARFDVLEG